MSGSSDGHRAPSSSASRVAALDCTRGLAMLFVCLSHFSWVAAKTIGHARTFGRLMRISMIASPTFVLVSGMTLGYRRGLGGARYDDFVRKVRERGVVLVSAVHVLMMPGFHYLSPGRSGALRTLPVTDTIGVCLLVGPSVVARFGVRRRLVLAAALVLGSWAIAVLAPASEPPPVRLVVDACFGTLGTSWWLYNFPIVPWFGAYLLGTVIGEDLATADAALRRQRVTTLLRWAGSLAASAVVVAVACLATARLLHGWSGAGTVLHRIADPFEKLPPSPVYLLAQGAAALLMTASAAIALERGWFQGLTSRIIQIGRSSLVVFVVQSYLYYVIELQWLPPRHAWPLAFLASIGVVYLTAWGWLRLGGNRLLSPSRLVQRLGGSSSSRGLATPVSGLVGSATDG